MTNVIIINSIANMGTTEVQYAKSLESALKKLELNQLYFMKAIETDGKYNYVLESTSESYLRYMREERNPNITEHDVESMNEADVRYWESFAIAIQSVNKRHPHTLPAVVVRWIADNDFVFYAEKTVNFGCEICAMTDARFLDEKPFTYKFETETYYSFATLEKTIQLEKDEMAKFTDEGEVIIVKKDVEILKNEGVRAIEANFADFLERIENDGLVFMGYLNSRLYYC